MLPYKRPYPTAIVQDPALLLKIKVFNYNLNDPAFVQYFEDRTGYLLKRGKTDQRGHEIDPNWKLNLELFGNPKKPLTLPFVKAAVKKHCGPKLARNVERIVSLEITKAKLQDVWMVYKRR